MKKIVAILTFFFICCISQNANAAYGDVTTWLSRIYTGDGGQPRQAYLDFCEDVLFDKGGNMIIADTYNNVIRKTNSSTTKIITLAGTGSYGERDGKANQAEFGQPRGLALSGSTTFVADTWNHKIRKISNGNVTTIVDDGLYFPEGVEVYGSTLYIADTGHGSIKKTSLNGGKVTTLISGKGLIAPVKLRADLTGKNLYVADIEAHKLFKISTSNGTIETIAGSTEGYKDATGTNAKFRFLAGVVLDEIQNSLFVTDGNGSTDYVRKINLATREATTIATDPIMVTLNYPKGLDIKGNYIFVANSGISSIQRIHRYTGVTLQDGDRVAGKKRFENDFGKRTRSLVGRPNDMIYSLKKKNIYVAENNLIRKIRVKDRFTKHVVGSVVDAYKEGIGSAARFSSISSIILDKTGKYLYLTDRWNNRIRRVNLATQETELVSGSGEKDCTGQCNGYEEGSKNTAHFSNPSGITISPDNKYLYVTDTSNNRIRRVEISTGETSFIAGSGESTYADGIGKTASFNRPYAITINKAGTKLYVADSYNNRIREIDIASKKVTTLAGNNIRGYRDGYRTDASFSTPNYVKMGSDNFLYTTEAGTHTVRVIDPRNGLVKTITGTDTRGFQNGDRYHTEFNNPSGILLRPKKGKLYVADTWNDLIRKVDITGSHKFYEKAPVVTGILPTNRYPYSGNPSETKYLDVTGFNFMSAATAYFGSFKANKTYFKNSTALTAVIPFGKMPKGTYDVKVVNIDGQEYTKKGAFVIE
ncbi:MAG: IPT/TIG domain-containing protein [Patescibacteria group bacterium]|jgi:DNA-binding beta-propeller fold protein YncE